MAEVHVEPKKHNSPTWVWILVGIAIIAIVAYFLLRNNKTHDTTVDRNTTSYIQGYYAGFNNQAEAA